MCVFEPTRIAGKYTERNQRGGEDEEEEREKEEEREREKEEERYKFCTHIIHRSPVGFRPQGICVEHFLSTPHSSSLFNS